MRTVSNSVVLACALFLTLPAAQMASAAGAKAGVSHTVVAASGTAAPAGGNYAIFTHVTVNARGEIALRCVAWRTQHERRVRRSR